VGTATSTFMSGLSSNVNYYFAVVAVDVHGNPSAYSNEHIDCVGGGSRSGPTTTTGCAGWRGQQCAPRPGTVQRSDGFQLMVPVTFPEGTWSRVTMKFTMDSRLCTPGQNGTTDKCGAPIHARGMNPCGDPWDRGALTFLVLDNCIANGGSCATNDNLELIRAITPFGTDAPPPAGTGVVPPRVVQLT